MTRLVRYGVLALLAALVGFSLIFAPSGRAQPRTWRTFTDDSLGFTLRTPADWVPVLVADNADRRPEYGDDVAWRSIGFFGPNSQIVFVDWWQNPDGLSPADWLAAYPPPMSLDPTLTLSTETASVAGRPAVRLTGRPIAADAGVPWHSRVQFRLGGWMVAVEYAALSPDDALFQTMLDGFTPLPPAIARLAATPLSTDLPPADYGIRQASCCGYTDPEYNPFPCNTAGDSSCPFPPCGNCTWWVRYRRTGDAIANLDRCTNDAITWGACAGQYYPYLLSAFPDVESVVLYGGQNHLSFVESNSGTGAFTASDLSWYDPCPANPFYSSYHTSNKSYILHPYRFETNKPPNPPSLDEPPDDDWLATRSPTLRWTDEGDPDDGPSAERRFNVSVSGDDGWQDYSGWTSRTDWQASLPADGEYTWRVKAHDGMLASNWSSPSVFHVDTRPPEPTITAMPAPGRWTNQAESITFAATDPAPGIGLAALKWGWDVSPPAQSTSSTEKTITLSSAGQGKHTLYLQAVDQLGNASAVEQAGWFGYDTVPPVVTLSAGNPAARQWFSHSVQLAFSAADPAPGAGVAQTRWAWLDGPPETVIAGVGGVATLPAVPGKHSLQLAATDAAGNASSVVSDWYGFDSLIPGPPRISVSCGIANNLPQNTCLSPTFTVSATDPLAGAGGLTYAFGWSVSPVITTGAWSTATTFSPPPLSAGIQSARYFLHVRARDGAGNVSSPATFGFWFDAAASGSLNPPPPTDFGVSLAGGRPFSAVPTVTLQAWGPNVTAARIDGAETGWQSLPFSATHVLSTTGPVGLPQRVAVWLRDADGLEFGPYFDEIIVDPVAPRGSVRVTGESESTLSLTISAWDDNSGVAAMRLGAWAAITQTAWLSFSRAMTWPAGGVVYAQFADRAGNVSAIFGTDGSDSSLTERVYLPIVRRSE